MSKSKLFSLIVVCFYLFGIVYFRNRLDWHSIFYLLSGMLLALACIWFSEGLSCFFDSGQNPELNPNWEVVVVFFGWLLLLLPLIYFIVKKIKS